MNRFTLELVVAVSCLVAMAAWAHERGKEKGHHAAPARTIDIQVTSEGFVPDEVRVKAGESVKLRVTRKTEKTCANDIVIKDYGVNKPLPLDKTVEVDLAPSKKGNVRFACGMNMIAGTIIVE